ncbi:hypothetical protein ACLOJK_041030 [Asimina triloba]
MSLKCSSLYLSQFRFTSPHLLASGDGSKGATIIGDVYVHPSAKVHTSAKHLRHGIFNGKFESIFVSITTITPNPKHMSRNNDSREATREEMQVRSGGGIKKKSFWSPLGTNVSISANARIGAGVRLISCIILDDVEIKENAVVIHSIVGWKSSIGKWSRVQSVSRVEGVFSSIHRENILSGIQAIYSWD